MTFFEFFDKETFDNICAIFAHQPQKVIYFGADEALMLDYIKRYEKIFHDRGADTEFSHVVVLKNDLKDRIEKIKSAVENCINADEEFAFDLTGGDDLSLVAIGAVYQEYRGLIQMHRFDLRENTISDCDADGKLIGEIFAPDLSVTEDIHAFGGDVIYETEEREGTIRWRMTPSLYDDIDAMWDILTSLYKKSSVAVWNDQISEFEAVCACAGSDGGLCFTADRARVDEWAKNNDKHVRHSNDLLKQLKERGLITDYWRNDENISVTFKNEAVKRCLTKEGNALEMKVYSVAAKAVSPDGRPTYNEVMQGVQIDWNGRTDDDPYGATNEIDVMMMRGMIPVFVSCKNGRVGMDELYKLNSVANRFGGKYTKKVLVATRLSELESRDDGDDPYRTSGEFIRYFRMRAKEMGIQLIEPMQLTEDTFRYKINNAYRAPDQQ